MRNTAYKLTAFTAIISAAGFMLRWLQDIQIFEEETGLVRRGMPISYIVAAVIVLAAASFGVIVLRLRRYTAPAEPGAALGGRSFLHTVVCIAAVLLMAASGVLQLLTANEEHFTGSLLTLRQIAGGAAVAAALALAFFMTGLSNPEKAGMRRLCSAVLILFAALWLIAVYKEAASDPVMWRFAVEVLALCSVMMAFYHVAGYSYGQPSPWASLFFCCLGAFLCIMSAIDDHTAAENLCYGATALVLLIWAYSIVANLGFRPLSTEAEPGTEPERGFTAPAAVPAEEPGPERDPEEL